MRFFLILTALFMTTVIHAQLPSEAAMKAKIRAEYKGATSIQLKGQGTTQKEFEDGSWKFYYKRPFEAKFLNPEFEGVTGVVLGTIRYIKAGNQYVFSNFYSAGTRMEGVENPSQDEVMKLLHTDLQKFLGYHYNEAVGDISDITIPADVQYKWDDLNHVEFNVNVTFSKKISDTQLQKVKYTYELHLYSDGHGKPWKSFSAFENDYKREIIATTTHTPDEMSALKTLYDINEGRKAEMAMASLPKVADAPVFKSDKQLFYYIHDKIMTSDAQKAKAHLYKVLSKSNFESGAVLKNRSQEWVEKLTDNIAGYQFTYCDYPKIQNEQLGQITFYDKELTKQVRFVGKEEGGTWKLREIVYYLPSKEKIASCKAIAGNCAEKPNLVVKEKISYKVGDIVDVVFSNGTFAGEIDKKDTNFDNRYYVKLLDGGSGYWVNDDVMQPSKAVKISFEVGDHVGIKQRNGLLYGTILEVKGDEYLIKLDESGYNDMWLPKQQLVKK